MSEGEVTDLIEAVIVAVDKTTMTAYDEKLLVERVKQIIVASLRGSGITIVR